MSGWESYAWLERHFLLRLLVLHDFFVQVISEEYLLLERVESSGRGEKLVINLDSFCRVNTDVPALSVELR